MPPSKGLEVVADQDTGSDSESMPDLGATVLPHLTFTDVLFRKIFTWGRLACVVGLILGLTLCDEQPVVEKSLKFVNVAAYETRICRDELEKDDDAGYYVAKVNARLKKFENNDLPDLSKTELVAECNRLAQAVRSTATPAAQKKEDEQKLKNVFGPQDNDFVWVFAMIALLIVLSVEGKPSDALLIFLGLAFRELGIITSEDIFRGLGKQAPILFGSLFVISAAFNETRVLERLLSPIVGAPKTYWGMILRLLVPVMLLSGVCANGPVCSMAMPLAVVAADQVGFDPKNFFLPLAYATSLGGLLTLIGSPPNLTVLSYLNESRDRIQQCTELMYKIKGKAIPETGILLDSDTIANSHCKFSIFDPGFLVVGFVNCVVGALFLWISMVVLSNKYPSKQQLADRKEKEDVTDKARTAQEHEEKAPLMPVVTAKPLAGNASSEAGYICEFFVEPQCSTLIGKCFSSTPLGTTPGVKLLQIWKDRSEYRDATTSETTGTEKLTLRNVADQGQVNIEVAQPVDATPPAERSFAAGNVLQLSVKTADAVAKIRRNCEGMVPASKFTHFLGRKRYKRLLYELALDSKIAGDDGAKVAAHDELFEELQCCKVGYDESKNLVLVEAFAGPKFEKLVREKRAEVTLVKPVPGTKPPRSVTTMDQSRGYFVFILFFLAVTFAAVSGLHPSLKRFNHIHTYFSIIAMIVVFTHILTWKNAVATMSSSVLFTFAFADATAEALEKSGAVRLISTAIQNVGTSGQPAAPLEGAGAASPVGVEGSKVILVMTLLFVALSIITQFINNNTTAQLFQAATFQVALSLGIPPKPMLALVVFGASACFCTPFGTSCNMYVQVPGGYAFGDYVKNGWMLQISSLLASVGCCYVWGELLQQPEV
ncbi:unnamed protein product [Amoebophrya sp. A120]|nr:unnamed protein product [Amoebophrya sp. A120]|eukprot:GSA120T00022778001.1